MIYETRDNGEFIEVYGWQYEKDDYLVGAIRTDKNKKYNFHPARKVTLPWAAMRFIADKIERLNNGHDS